MPDSQDQRARAPEEGVVRTRITARQKQALIDNLQLEITERARKLRAQYAMQAQGLRSRVELRVNRIPRHLREVTMEELATKQFKTESANKASVAKPSAPIRSIAIASPSKNLMQEHQSQNRQSPSPARPTKRLSDDVDKENDDVANPKKRSKTNAMPAQEVSRRTQDNQVLSPRSANSRSQMRSPIRPPPSPAKSMLARPISPIKPVAPTLAGGAAGMLTHMVEKAKTSRGPARKVTASSSASNPPPARAPTRARKPLTAAAAPTAMQSAKARTSNASQSSDASSGTVVTKAITKKVPPKKGVMGTIRGIGTAAAKKAMASKPPPATTGRVLRKRA